MENILKVPHTKLTPKNGLKNIFTSIEEAVSELHLDRRRKYIIYGNELIYAEKITLPCSGCDNREGCPECGYTGKRVDWYPQPVWIGKKIVKIIKK